MLTPSPHRHRPRPAARWSIAIAALLLLPSCIEPLDDLALDRALESGTDAGPARDDTARGDAAQGDAAGSAPGGDPNATLPITVDDRCTVPSVTIAEVLADPDGPDGAGEAEFIELATLPRASLADAELLVIGRDGTVRESIALLEPADGAGLLVIGGFEVPGARVFPRLALQQSGATLRLVGCDGETIDELTWGDGTGTGPWPQEGASLVRCGGGATWTSATPTPSESAQQPLDPTCGAEALPEVCDATGAAGVHLVEVLPNPDGSDDATTEFVELHVPAGASGAVTIGLVDGADPSSEPAWLTVALPTAAAPALLLLGATHRDASTGPLGIALQNGTDALVLRDCTRAVLDGVAWGPDAAALGAVLGVAAGPAAASGQSLAWCDGARAWAAASPTPASPNDAFLDPASCPGSCEPQTRRPVVIHEVLFDPPGPDGDGALEFVELRGPAGASLEGWSLVGIDGVRGTTWLGPLWLDLRLNDDGIAVLGGSEVLSDLPLGAPLQNGPDGLALLGCDGTIGDAVAWGNPLDFAWGVGEGSAAAPPAAGSSLGRDPAATDTGDNARDFAARVPSPGIP